MAKTLGKNLHFCFSAIKSPQPQITLPSSSNNNPYNTNNNNTPNEQDLLNNNHPSNNDQSTTSTAITTFIKNYNSLYEDMSTSPAPASPLSDIDTDMADIDDYDEAVTVAAATPDLTAVYASRRFFISSPGISNSIVDSLSCPSSSPENDDDPPVTVVSGGVPVDTYSPNPYVDFRQSMQEMVESRDLGGADGKETWDYLQDLLLSYLSLNPKSAHKYIVGAFADLVVTLMSPNNCNNPSSISTSSTTIASCSSSSSPSSSSSCAAIDADHNHQALGMLMYHTSKN